MLTSRKHLFPTNTYIRTIQRISCVKRSIQTKAIANEFTNVVVGVIAIGVFVDVASTFYKHRKTNNTKDLSVYALDSYDSDDYTISDDDGDYD